MPKNNKPHKKKKLWIRIVMIVLAAALAVGILILPMQSLFGVFAEDGAITVDSFDTGMLSEAISEAADGTDYNQITKISVSGGTLNASDWNALTAIPNLEYIELANAQTESGIVPENALPSRNRLAYISLPHNTAEIGEKAFNNNKVLAKISMPDTVTKIGNYAFEACEALEAMPNSVNITEMGEGAFKDCKSFESFTVSPKITEIPAYAFSKCGFSEIIIGPDVKTIGEGAFADCNNLKNIYVYAEEAPTIQSSSFMNVSADVHAYEDSDYSAWNINNLKTANDLEGEYPVKEPEKPAETTAATEETSAADASDSEKAEPEESDDSETSAEAENSGNSENSGGVGVVTVIIIVIMAVIIAVLATILIMSRKK